MRRFGMVPLLGDGSADSSFRPDILGSYSLLGIRGSWCLVKYTVSDGTPATASTLVDLVPDGFVAANLTPAQQTTIKAWLAARGFDTSRFDGDGVTDRRRLLRFALRRLFDVPEYDGGVLEDGFQAVEEAV